MVAIGLCIATSMIVLAYHHHFTLWSVALPPILLFVVDGMVFAYCFGKCLSLFPNMAGTASAAMGALYSIVAAIVSALSTTLKTNTLMPLALSYFAIMLLMAIFFVLREVCHQQPSFVE